MKNQLGRITLYLKTLAAQLNIPRIIRLRLKHIGRRFDEVLINQGRIMAALNSRSTQKDIKNYEFKVFSQWGEDGILQFLTSHVPILNRTFIEFGVEDFYESNCRFLMMKDNWQGFVIDGSKENINRLSDSYFFWMHDLRAISAFIDTENINRLMAESGFDSDLGILSIDLDGNDYYILDAINFYRPRILICEYNAVFGPTRKISIPYSPKFIRSETHYSNLYFGASLSAICALASKKGYDLVGTNSASSNAFFVRNDLRPTALRSMTVGEAYAPSRLRESRDESGRLSFIAGDDRLLAITGMPVFNTETEKLERL